MSRENTYYRLNLELINEMYPDGASLTIHEAMDVTKIRSINTLRKHFGKRIVCGTVSKAVVAKYLCGGI